MRGIGLTRRIVKKEVPEFRFSANSFAIGDARALQLPNFEGGCVMGEGLRMERVAHLGQWTRTAEQWRDTCWPYNVQVMPLYQISGDKHEGSRLDELYGVIVHFPAGMHLGAHPPETPVGSLSDFSKRFSEYLWDPMLRAPSAPEKLVSFAAKKDFFLWPEFVRTRKLPNGRQRLVMHLVNIPEDYRLYRGHQIAAAPPVRNQKLSIALPKGAKAPVVFDVDPFRSKTTRKLDAAIKAGKLTFTVPDIRYWNMLVVEFAEDELISTKVNLRQQQESYIQDWKVIGPFAGDLELTGFERPGPVPVLPDFRKTYKGKNNKTVKWIDYRKPDQPKFAALPTDLGEAFGVSYQPAMFAYAATNVESDRERDVLLFAKGDETIAIWVNGKQVMAKNMGEMPWKDEESAKIHLKKGKNIIFVKCHQKWLYWEFVLRLAELDGYPLTQGAVIGVPR